MCEGSGCESRDNILDWLKGKYIVLLYNQIRFDQSRYFEESRIKEARISYIPVSSQNRQIVAHNLFLLNSQQCLIIIT